MESRTFQEGAAAENCPETTGSQTENYPPPPPPGERVVCCLLFVVRCFIFVDTRNGQRSDTQHLLVQGHRAVPENICILSRVLLFLWLVLLLGLFNQHLRTRETKETKI